MPVLLISARAVSFEHRSRSILNEVNLQVHAGERIAVVGPTGSGKSTLLRLLADLEQPTSGSISRSRKARIALLPQVSEAGSELSVRDELAARVGLGAAEREMERLTRRLGEGDLSAVEAHAEAVERWAALGGGDFDARIPGALESVGIEPAWESRRFGSLSGGEMARIRLAALDLARIDCALLDEPGNHLDTEGLEKLEGRIQAAPYAVIFASHDRQLLDRLSTDVIEIEGTRVRRFTGGWRGFVQERENERRLAEPGTAWQPRKENG